MAAVARHSHTNGTGTNGTATPREESHDLDDLDAALLQTIIAKRVVALDDALKILETLADVTGNIPRPHLAAKCVDEMQIQMYRLTRMHSRRQSVGSILPSQTLTTRCARHWIKQQAIQYGQSSIPHPTQ